MTTRQGSSAPSTGSTYAGSLQAKKKAELQEIAQALNISNAGTREDLQQRIRKHLDDNSKEYEDDPTFTGLFGNRKRQKSLQPQPQEAPKPSGSRQSLNSIQEDREPSPAAEDVRDVSMMIPQVQTPVAERFNGLSTPPITRAAKPVATPSQVPLPPSPAKSIIAEAMAQPEVKAVVEMEKKVFKRSKRLYWQIRAVSFDALSWLGSDAPSRCSRVRQTFSSFPRPLRRFPYSCLSTMTRRSPSHPHPSSSLRRCTCCCSRSHIGAFHPS